MTDEQEPTSSTDSSDAPAEASEGEGGRPDRKAARSDELKERLADALGPEFEVIRSLGRGRMAEVFLAREVELRRLVAVKVLRPELAVQDAPRKRFLREARSAASISHPNVVKVYRVGTFPDATPYLTMEYVDGRTMEDVLAADGPRPEEEVRELLRQMAGALGAAHEQGIIHRDVRPNNIMRTREGERFVLADFGVAGILESGDESTTRLTGAGEILGEAGYTAPEQLEGNPVRPESDIYALAVTAYELLARTNPYGAEKVAEILQAHLTRDPTPISRLRPGVSQEMEELLLRCLAKRPEHRPPARNIRARLDGEAGSALGPVPGEGALAGFLRELKRRHVYKSGATYAAVAVVLLGVADPLEVLFPEWLFKVLILLVLAGFPVTLILAWAYDITAGGVERTASTDAASTSTTTRIFQVVGLVVSLALVVGIGWLLLR